MSENSDLDDIIAEIEGRQPEPTEDLDETSLVEYDTIESFLNSKQEGLADRYRTNLRPWLQHVLKRPDETDIVKLWNSYYNQIKMKPQPVMLQMVYSGLLSYFTEMKNADPPFARGTFNYRWELIQSTLNNFDIELKPKMVRNIRRIFPKTGSLLSKPPLPWEFKKITTVLDPESKLFYYMSKSSGARPEELVNTYWSDILNWDEVLSGKENFTVFFLRHTKEMRPDPAMDGQIGRLVMIDDEATALLVDWYYIRKPNQDKIFNLDKAKLRNNWNRALRITGLDKRQEKVRDMGGRDRIVKVPRYVYKAYNARSFFKTYVVGSEGDPGLPENVAQRLMGHHARNEDMHNSVYAKYSLEDLKRMYAASMHRLHINDKKPPSQFEQPITPVQKPKEDYITIEQKIRESQLNANLNINEPT